MVITPAQKQTVGEGSDYQRTTENHTAYLDWVMMIEILQSLCIKKELSYRCRIFSKTEKSPNHGFYLH